MDKNFWLSDAAGREEYSGKEDAGTDGFAADSSES